MPEGANQYDLRMHMRNRYGVLISSGHGEMKDLLLRIGHMGYSAKMPYIMVALSALGKSLRDFGVAVNVGAGIEAALAEF
jgi:pyridoxamine--pyruvate transaminase